MSLSSQLSPFAVERKKRPPGDENDKNDKKHGDNATEDYDPHANAATLERDGRQMAPGGGDATDRFDHMPGDEVGFKFT